MRFSCFIIGLAVPTYLVATQLGTLIPFVFASSEAWAKNDKDHGGGNGDGKGGGKSGGHGSGSDHGNSDSDGNGNGNSDNSGNNGNSGNAPGVTSEKNDEKENTPSNGITPAATTEVQPAPERDETIGHDASDKAIAHEIVVADASERDVAKKLGDFARANGLGVISQESLSGLGISVTRLSIPANLSLTSTRTRLKAAFPNASIDYNHVFTPQAGITLPAPDYAWKQIGWDRTVPDCGAAPQHLGMLDTLVDPTTPLLAGAAVTQQQFLDTPDAQLSETIHGSTIASFLVGNNGFGLLPDASLSIAGIFTVDQGGQPVASATAFVAGLNWLVGSGVTIVNTSLSGPKNALMELAVRAAVARHISIVAAVGNDGLQQVPRFPAAYPGVIGVTAVDVDRHPYTLANSGSFVSFAAPGVDLWVPTGQFHVAAAVNTVDGRYVSGTSFAAPFVAAALAVNGNDVDILAQAAIDLGAAGKDPVFGYGLLQATLTCAAGEQPTASP